jgi:hypothetical protein
MHDVRTFTERESHRGPHGQESEEGKEDRQGSHQKGGQEDDKEKEVVAPTTVKLASGPSERQAKPPP